MRYKNDGDHYQYQPLASTYTQIHTSTDVWPSVHSPVHPSPMNQMEKRKNKIAMRRHQNTVFECDRRTAERCRGRGSWGRHWVLRSFSGVFWETVISTTGMLSFGQGIICHSSHCDTKPVNCPGQGFSTVPQPALDPPSREGIFLPEAVSLLCLFSLNRAGVRLNRQANGGGHLRVC